MPNFKRRSIAKAINAGASAKTAASLDARGRIETLEKTFGAPQDGGDSKSEKPMPGNRFQFRSSTLAKSAVALSAVALFGWQPVQRLLATTSTEAVINAPVATIRAPIDGILDLAALNIGTLIGEQTQIAVISDSRADRQHLDNLKRAEGDLQTLIGSLEAKQKVLQQAKGTLADQQARFRAGRAEQLQQRVAEIDRNIEEADAGHRQAADKLSRTIHLESKGLATQTDLDIAVRDERVTLEKANALAEKRKGVLVELEAARSGAFVGDSYNDTPQSAQRSLDVALEAADVAARLEGSHNQLASAEAAIAAEEQNLQERSNVIIRSRAKGRVWELLASPGEHVKAGQDLMRLIACDSGQVTASVSQSAYQNLFAGQRATFKPRGESVAFEGRVTGLRGFSAGNTNSAIPESALNREPYHVVLEFPDLAGYDKCDVGRMGIVTFDTRTLDAAPATATVKGTKG